MCKYLHVLVFCTIFVRFVMVGAQVGAACETPNNKNGLCLSVYDCKPVLDILSSQGITQAVRTFLKGLSCGYSNNKPLVCCLQESTRNIHTAVPVDPTISTSETHFLLPTQCGRSNSTIPKVVGGLPAQLGQFPWIVALGYKNTRYPDQPKWLCGASLVSEKHVITAAHCVHNRPDLYLARLGELDLYSDKDSANPTDILITEAKIHDAYSPIKFTNDIAILTLATPAVNLPGVWPICLPWQSEMLDKSFLNEKPYVAGWGAVYFNGPSSSILQFTVLPVIENSNCQRVYGNRSVIDHNIICAGYPQGRKDACQGDSGGPLMLAKQSGQGTIEFYLIGVVSYGFRCAEVGYPGVYTRITNFIPWIQKNLE